MYLGTKFMAYAILLTIVNLKADDSCGKINSANDIVKCLQVNHPEVISDETIKKVSEKVSKQGNAWKNPEVSFETVGGQSLGSNVIESELRVSQTIEFSGQRSSRKRQGHALMEEFKANGHAKIEEVTLSGVKSLYRLLQIKDELSKVDESLKQFKSINEQYQARPRLNPEQEITFGLIQLSISDFSVKRSQLLSEKNEILTELAANSKLTTAEIENNLPSPILNWEKRPTMSEKVNNATLDKLKAGLNMANASLSLAKAEAWPEFTLDVIAQNNIDGSLQYQTFGLGIRLPVPIFERNQGEKSLKAVELSKASHVYEAALRKQEITIENLAKNYEESVKNLMSNPSAETIEKRHRKAEQLFSQGMISGPLIIETHRQLLEYSQNRNQEELRAIEALWRLHILNGTFLEQKI